MRVTVIAIVIGSFVTVSKVFEKGLEELEIRGRIEDHLDHSIVFRLEYSRKVLVWKNLIGVI